MSQNGDQDTGKQNERVAKDAEIVDQLGSTNSSSSNGWQSGSRQNIGGVWTYGPVRMDGCWPACVTFALFLVCLGQFGVLAAIGFLVFHTIGGAIGSVRAARALTFCILWNPWPWRVGNWFISFILTAWLAGGLG